MTERSFDGSELFARIARDLAEQADLRQTIERITELTVRLTDCSTAALWSLTSGDHANLQACTDPMAAAVLSRILHDIDQGPARTVLVHREVVHVQDIETETRWPQYLEEIRSSGLAVRSVLGYPLLLADRHLGALMLYSPKPGYFTDDLLQIASVLAGHAAIALDAATSADKAHNLSLALQSNRRIGMAVGILMALHRLDERQAFDLLRVASQHRHQKLRQIAEEVILTGALPSWPIRPLPID